MHEPPLEIGAARDQLADDRQHRVPLLVIRLPHGIMIELENASPSWIAALARELARSAS